MKPLHDCRIPARLVFLFLLVLGNQSFAQLLPAGQPEQDACNALVICGNGFTSPYSYQGYGQTDDLPNTPCGAGESNSVWLRLNIITAGTIVFTISPLDLQDDYDWAVLNVTGQSCSNLPYSSVIRCNFNNNVNPTSTSGITGLNMTSTATTTQSGTSGQNFLRWIDAAAGDSYLIMINNFGHDVSGNNLGSGFTIDFTGSTAVFNDQQAPSIDSITDGICGSASTMVLKLSEQVKCSSIAADGSDFQISPAPYAIVGASGVNCNSNGTGYTDLLYINFSGSLPPNNYTLKAKTGSDANTLLDLCDNAMLVGDSLNFYVYNGATSQWKVDTFGCSSLEYQGVTYTQTTTLLDTIRTHWGCDSVYKTTNIKIYTQPDVISYAVSGCDTVSFRGITYRSDATVVDTFVSQLGCDSMLHVYNIDVQTLELAVAADPPEPVIGDYVTFKVTASDDNFSVSAWLPQTVFPNQVATVQHIIIQHSDTVKVVGMNGAGCVDTAVLYVKADTLVPVVMMPNAFSPNGDGLNDVFEPLFVNKSGYTVKSLKVFNRWGQVVYSAQGTKKASWNGLYSNADKVADVGTYYYYLDVLFIDGTKAVVKGDVTLLR
ncbi:MAG: gliding motility-associated C-terminal domain-containing protein [Edaphocola sp.]